MFGPRKQDALASRSDALVALGDAIDHDKDKKLKLRSSELAIVPSPGGRSAWAFDVIDVEGEPHAVTAILVNTDDIWQVDTVLVAHMPARGLVKSELAKDAVVPPAADAKAKIDATARPAVERFQKGLLDQDAWGEDLAAHTDAVVVGPTVGEVARGKKEIKKLFKKRGDAKMRAAMSGEITAGATPDGQLAWVTAPITRAADKEDPTPLRAFAVYEHTDTGWTMIALHESLALDAPGSGASFKKTVPPAPAEEKPEEPPKKKEASKDAKDSKKKPASKKKKKRSL
ncbi:MAG TPA: nuclear transport factor 2 family protein [Kofleriaceae bacterium]|nr:nuclear transport factor 2 family protein [Kofleriaceae bacterium]